MWDKHLLYLVSQYALRAQRWEATKFIKNYEVATNILFKEKLLENYLIWQNWLFENEIGLGSLVMPREWWKHNSTALLMHPSRDGYPRACYEN